MNKDRANYALTAGNGLQGIPGRVRFFGPAAEQAFKRSMLHHKRPDSPHVLYDPFCGTGAALVYPLVLQRAKIAKVIGSDIDKTAVDVAEWNLKLCTVEAVGRRLQEIRHAPETAKPGETEANLMELAEVMRKYGCTAEAALKLFAHDMFTPIPEAQVPTGNVSVVVTDPPYGQATQFTGATAGAAGAEDALYAAYLASLKTLRPVLQDGGTASIITDFRDKLGPVLETAPEYTYKELKRVTGGAYGRNFREIHTLTAS